MFGEEQQSVDEEKRLRPLTLQFDTATWFFLKSTCDIDHSDMRRKIRDKTWGVS